MIRNYKITKRIWAAAIALMFIAPSCDLQIDETDSLLTQGESAFFNGVDNPGASLDQIYNDISGQTGDQANLYALTEVTTDELMVPTRGTDWGDNGVWRTLHQHTWTPTHAYLLQVWNDKNGAVLRASQILDPLTKNVTAEQKGQAQFARAYNMWIVMDFFGQVPFRNPSDGPEIIPDVMTRAEAYDMIVKDLTDAIANLSASNPTAADKFRPVKDAARFWLAKVKLNANIYKGAYGSTDLQDVIDLVDQIEADGYSPSSDYFETFHGPNYSNTDVIWAVNTSDGNRMWDGLHYNQATPDNVGGGWNGFTTMADFYDKFEGPADDNSFGLGQEERRGYTQTPETTNKDNAGFGFGFQFGQMYGWRYKDSNNNDTPAPTDNDKVGHLVSLTTRTGDPLIFTKDLPGLIGNNEVTGIRVLKYSPANGGFTSGVVMARYADALLMRAEAKMRSGDNGGALADVNSLRATREHTSALGAISEATMLDERARELYTEGWRRNDMIRFGTFKGSWQFKDGENTADGHTDLFPIPPSALLSNPGLVQNPGY